jgi:uncharacterized protein YdcH (DUF465 family)
MNTDSPEFKTLLAGNEDFRKLYKEHEKYEKQLNELARNRYLTPEQEIQRKTIQKLKLSGKDRMSLMIRQAQDTQERGR